MSSIEALDFILEEKSKGVSYSLIKAELAKSGFSEREIKLLIEQADEEILENLQLEQLNSTSNTLTWLGIVFIGVGLIFCLIPLLKLKSLTWIFFIGCAQILSGIVMLLDPKIRFRKSENRIRSKKNRPFNKTR